MAGTRSSARTAAKGSASSAPAQSKPSTTAGGKRKAGNSGASTSKRGKKNDDKQQTSIEDSMPATGGKEEGEDVDMKDTEEAEKLADADGPQKGNEAKDTDEKHPAGATKDEDGKSKANGDSKDHQAKGETGDAKPNGFDKLMDNDSNNTAASNNITEEGTGSKVKAADNAVETSSQREEATPSSILEKGIIYFFFRGRVGINEPNNVADVARSYMILRPLPQGAKLGDGPIGDEKNNRMLALPKKVLPKSPKDRFMTFVEKANVSMDEIKDTLSSSDYSTKTAGVRHTPAAAPIGEGVYALTQTGRDTHLAYILTIPSELSDVQKDVGLRQRGSYFTSAKNPQSSGPSNANLPQGAEYPQEIIDEFHGRGWMPLQPKLLNYTNTQFLIIGHGDEALEKAARPQDGEDQKPDMETPLEEVEKLEHEDELRVQHLDGADTVFTDLGLSQKEYPKVQTTW